jgi:hypothetical protein
MAAQANGLAGLKLPQGVADCYPGFADAGPDGRGLAIAPFIRDVLGGELLRFWEMSPAEQTALVFLLQQLRPRAAIEIGTRFGGSLQVLSRFCRRVWSLDIDPDVPERLRGRFANVEYVIGPSEQTLPRLLVRLQASGEELGFALVDGDHSAEGVRRDLDHLLRYTPNVPFFIVMHDSFNPRCRRGIKTANWAANPYVHAVELDFVPGSVHPSPAFRGQLWGGLALACLNPHTRQGPIEVVGRGDLAYRLALTSAPRLLISLGGRSVALLRRIRNKLLGKGGPNRSEG